MSKGSWNLRSTEVARLVNTVKAIGLPIRNVEYSPETKLLRINVGSSAEGRDDTVDGNGGEWD